MRAHLLSPGVSSARLSGGGTSLFRAMAALLSQRCETVVYEPTCTEVEWSHAAVLVRPWNEPRDAVNELMRSIRRGDVVIKVAGALPGRWDMCADIELATHRASRGGIRLVYVDVDAPSRLGILQYCGTYLDTVTPVADAVITCGGGARAFHAYRNMGASPVTGLTVAISWYGLPPLVKRTRHHRFDVAAVFGGDRARHRAVVEISQVFAREGLTVAVVGSAQQKLRARINNLGFLDGQPLLEVIADSRFSLSLLRKDVAGFADAHPCRIVEAVRVGSMIVSEPFLGISRLVVPEREFVPLDSDYSALARKLRRFDERQRLTATRRARRRIEALASREAQEFLTAVFRD